MKQNVSSKIFELQDFMKADVTCRIVQDIHKIIIQNLLVSVRLSLCLSQSCSLHFSLFQRFFFSLFLSMRLSIKTEVSGEKAKRKRIANKKRRRI